MGFVDGTPEACELNDDNAVDPMLIYGYYMLDVSFLYAFICQPFIGYLDQIWSDWIF